MEHFDGHERLPPKWCCSFAGQEDELVARTTLNVYMYNTHEIVCVCI